MMVSETGNMEGLSQSTVLVHRQLVDAEAFLQSGRYENAQEMCRELLSEHGEYVGALDVLGRAYAADHNYEAALPCFIWASMLSPFEPSILLQLGVVYFNLGAQRDSTPDNSRRAFLATK